MGKTAWIGIAVIAVILLGFWFWSQNTHASQISPGASSASAQMPVDTAGAAGGDAGAAGGTADAPVRATVMYDGSTFSPSTVTVRAGGTVTFTDTAGTMWVASNQHPSHTGYDGTSRAAHCAAGYSGPAPFDQCGPGTSYSFTFNKSGSWDYHDHMNAGAGGTVVVQ